MKSPLFLLLIFLFGFSSKPESKQKTINVLFIGNSLTYYHDMPKMLQNMLNESHPNYNIEQSAFPGMTLDDHLNNIIFKRDGDNISTRDKETGEITETEKKLSEKKWDIIILQENPGFLYYPRVLNEIINPAIKKIKQLANNPYCKFILFNTWIPWGNYPIEKRCTSIHHFKFNLNKKDSVCSKSIQNIEEDLRVLNESSEKIAKDNGLFVTNHCNLYYKIQTEFPEFKLYEADGHPSELGSFFDACVFYKELTGSMPSKLKFHGNLILKDSEILKKISD